MSSKMVSSLKVFGIFVLLVWCVTSAVLVYELYQDKKESDTVVSVQQEEVQRTQQTLDAIKKQREADLLATALGSLRKPSVRRIIDRHLSRTGLNSTGLRGGRFNIRVGRIYHVAQNDTILLHERDFSLTKDVRVTIVPVRPFLYEMANIPQ